MEVGIDIVEVPRFERVVARRGERLLRRLFTPQEIAYAYSAPPELAIQRLAARFAAKEAFIKALGKPVPFKELEVITVGRKPTLRWRGGSCPVSLSHTASLAAAVVLLPDPTPRR